MFLLCTLPGGISSMKVFSEGVKEGVAVRVRKLCASPQVQSRLREMGLREDQIIKLLVSQTSFICQVCNTRLAISEQLARLIMVEPIPTPVRVAA